MPTPILQSGGVAGLSAKIAVFDDGSVSILDANGSSLLSLSSAGAMSLASSLAIAGLTASGDVTLGDASADTITFTGRVAGPITFKVGSTSVLDCSAIATGGSDVVLGDNLADAFTFREAASAFLTFITSNLAETIHLQKPVRIATQTLDMADATVALVYGSAAGAGEVLLTGSVLLVDPNSGGASEILKLPLDTGLGGMVLWIVNTGGEGIVVQTSAGGAVGTIPTTKSALVGTTGSGGWGFLLGA